MTAILLQESKKSGILVEYKGKSTKIIPSDVTEGSTLWALHGVQDNQPLLIKQDLNLVGVLRRALLTRRNLHYGKGLVPYKVEVSQEGTLSKKVTYSNEIVSFMRSNRAALKQTEIIRALEEQAISYVEIILNRDRSKIVSFKPIDPLYCRIEKINEKYGRSQYAYIDGEFAELNGTPTPRTKVPLLDMRNPIDHLQNGKSYKYIVALKYEDGNLYYPVPAWNSLRDNGWLDVVKSIPTIKKAIFDNQMTLKYHIEISDFYLSLRYPKWDTFDDKQKKENFAKLLTEIQNQLIGASKSGKSLMSVFKIDQRSGKELQGIRINPIKTELNDGMFNMDTADGNSQILFTVGLNPAILGHGVPGGKELSGSGSDIRESLLAHRAQIEPERVVSTEIWRLIGDFNQWGENLDWGYIDNDTSQTLDENPTGSQDVLN